MRVPLLETLSDEADSIFFVVLNENVFEKIDSPLSPFMRTTTASLNLGNLRADCLSCGNPSIAVAAAAKFLAVVFPFLATRALH